jgi:hypothetical protein
MYDPDIHTWDVDGDRLDRDRAIESDDELGNVTASGDDVEYEHDYADAYAAAMATLTGLLGCPEWGGEHRYEEQETWDHRIVIGCNCGHTPPKDDDDPR